MSELGARQYSMANKGALGSLDALAKWMVDDALPLWTSFKGYGGMPIVEAADFKGQVLDLGYLRLRVIARQVSVLSTASTIGIASVRSAADSAWLAFVQRFYSPVTGWASRIGPYGQVIELDFTLYDQAFAVYACACRARLTGDSYAIALAQKSLRLIDRLLGSNGQMRGWRSAKNTPERDQNSHMHLLEALLALHELAPSFQTEKMILEVLHVATCFLHDETTNTISENFGSDWSPSAQPRVEPGHQFEWYWLLAKAEKMGFTIHFPRDRLFSFATLYGLSSDTGLIIDACTPEGVSVESSHRLWPHCEAIRAATVHSDTTLRTRYAEEFAEHLMGSFLGPAKPGTWHDRLDNAGNCTSSFVPASSLYHLWEAVTALHEAGLAKIPGAPPCS